MKSLTLNLENLDTHSYQKLLLLKDYNLEEIFFSLLKLSFAKKVYLTQNIIYCLETERIYNTDTKSWIVLPDKEDELLKYFIKNKNRLISSKELSEKVWYNKVTNITIKARISLLRKYTSKNIITTHRGKGYILIAL